MKECRLSVGSLVSIYVEVKVKYFVRCSFHETSSGSLTFSNVTHAVTFDKLQYSVL